MSELTYLLNIKDHQLVYRMYRTKTALVVVRNMFDALMNS